MPDRCPLFSVMDALWSLKALAQLTLIRQLNVSGKDLWRGHGGNPLKPISCARVLALSCSGSELVVWGPSANQNPESY